MANTFSEASTKLFDPARSVIPFLLGSLSLAVLGNAVFELLTHWLGKDAYGMGIIVAGTTGLLLVSVFVLRWWLIRAAVFVPAELGQPCKRQGLVLLVSSSEIAEQAIHFHSETLRYCWLVCSEHTRKLAEELRAKLPARCQIKIVELSNDALMNPVLAHRKLRDIQDSLPRRLDPDDVIFDLTGMTKLVSVGMALACATRSSPMQYIPVNRDKNGDPTGPPLPPIEIRLRIRTSSSRETAPEEDTHAERRD